MEMPITRKHDTYQTLNVIWGVLTSIFLLLALHFIWQNEVRKLNEQLEATTQSVRTSVDNFIDNMTNILIK